MRVIIAKEQSQLHIKSTVVDMRIDKLKLSKNVRSVIACSVIITLFSTAVSASVPSFFRNLESFLEGNSEEDTLLVIDSIPVLEELTGIRFSAVVIDLSSGNPIALSGNGVFPLDVPEVFYLACAVDMMLEDNFASGTLPEIETVSSWIADAGMDDTYFFETGSIGSQEVIPSSTAEDVVRALRIVHSGMNIPGVVEIIANPDMGEGQASFIEESCDLYGWVNSGTNHKTFVLIAMLPDGRELGFVLLSDDLCCEEKGDLAMMLLWQTAQQCID